MPVRTAVPILQVRKVAPCTLIHPFTQSFLGVHTRATHPSTWGSRRVGTPETRLERGGGGGLPHPQASSSLPPGRRLQPDIWKSLPTAPSDSDLPCARLKATTSKECWPSSSTGGDPEEWWGTLCSPLPWPYTVLLISESRGRGAGNPEGCGGFGPRPSHGYFLVESPLPASVSLL